MNIQINDVLFERLDALASQQNREVSELVQEAIAVYLNARLPDDEKEAFRKDVRRLMQEHQWLLDELAKQ